MKIHCLNPGHKDDTPSLHIYPDRSYCFGCGYSCPTDTLDLSEEVRRKLNVQREDIRERLTYIAGLPVHRHRGLAFPTDSEGYYIRYPEREYYKQRLFRGKTRYIGPGGIPTPLLIYRASTSTLVLVEGEINLLSLREAYPETAVTLASPGAASSLTKFVNDYLQYSNIHAIVDYDAAGVINALKLREALKKHGKRLEIHAIEPDLNDILVSQGVDGVRKKVKEEGLAL